jgi:hypothetical protein
VHENGVWVPKLARVFPEGHRDGVTVPFGSA